MFEWIVVCFVFSAYGAVFLAFVGLGYKLYLVSKVPLKKTWLWLFLMPSSMGLERQDLMTRVQLTMSRSLTYTTFVLSMIAGLYFLFLNNRWFAQVFFELF